jgi:hypothetical protein
MPLWEKRLRAGKKILLEAGFEGFIKLKVSEMLFKLMTDGDILGPDEITWELTGVVMDKRLLDYDFVFIPEFTR